MPRVAAIPSAIVLVLAVIVGLASGAPHASRGPSGASHAAVRQNASTQFVIVCDVAGGGQFAAEWVPSNVAARFSRIPSAKGAEMRTTAAADDAATVVHLGSPFVRASCAADGGILIVAAYAAAAVAPHGGEVIFLLQRQNAVAVAGNKVYVATESESFDGTGQLYGFDMAAAVDGPSPSSALLFNRSVRCTFLLEAQPAAASGSLPAANQTTSVWLGCLNGNGTMLSGTTGEVLAPTPARIGAAVAFASTPSALVAMCYGAVGTEGVGVSWTTGEVLWTNPALNSMSGSLMALPAAVDAVVSALAIPGQPAAHCTLTTVSARTGATIAALNFSCEVAAESGGDLLSPVANAETMVAVEVVAARETRRLHIFDALRGVEVGQPVSSPSSQRCDGGGVPCPPVLNRVASCAAGGTVLAVAHTTPSEDGLVEPTRITILNVSRQGPAPATSAHVFAHRAVSVGCSGDVVTVVTAGAIVVSEPTTLPRHAQGRTSHLGEARTPNVSVAALWNLTTSSLGTNIAGAALADTGALIVLNVSNVSDGAARLERFATGSSPQPPVWSVLVEAAGGAPYSAFCTGLLVDSANGFTWALCRRTVTVVNTSSGRIAFQQEQRYSDGGGGGGAISNIVCAPGFVIYSEQIAAGSGGGGQFAILRRAVGYDGQPWSAPWATPLSTLGPFDVVRSVRIVTPGPWLTAVALVAPANPANPWQQPALVQGVDTAAGWNVTWRVVMPVYAMPCGGTSTHVLDEKVVVIGSVDGVPTVVGIDPRTGATAWSHSITDAVDPSQPGATVSASCAAIHHGVITLATPSSVIKLNTVGGSVVWRRDDERYFVPSTGMTFAGSALQGVARRLAVTIADGVWLLDPTSGVTAGRPLTRTVLRPQGGGAPLGAVAGHPDLLLCAGLDNVSVVTNNGTLVASTQMPASTEFGQPWPFTWTGTALTTSAGSDDSVAAIFSAQWPWLGLFSVADAGVV